MQFRSRRRRFARRASGSEEKENFKDDFSMFEQLAYDGAI